MFLLTTNLEITNIKNEIYIIMIITKEQAKVMLERLHDSKLGKTRGNGTKTRKAQNQENAEQMLLRIIQFDQQPSTEERRSLRNVMNKLSRGYTHTVATRPTAKGKGQEHGSRFNHHHQVAHNLKLMLTSPNSAPTSRTGSPESSRSSRSRSNNNTTIQMPAATRKYTKKVHLTPPTSGKWPVLKKGKQLWSVKIIPVSESRINIMKIHGYEGKTLTTSTTSITSGKADRSLSREAKYRAQEDFNDKKADGYKETTNVRLNSNNEIKSINNFVAN